VDLSIDDLEIHSLAEPAVAVTFLLARPRVVTDRQVSKAVSGAAKRQFRNVLRAARTYDVPMTTAATIRPPHGDHTR
jgi:hypothetical protein